MIVLEALMTRGSGVELYGGEGRYIPSRNEIMIRDQVPLR